MNVRYLRQALLPDAGVGVEAEVAVRHAGAHGVGLSRQRLARLAQLLRRELLVGVRLQVRQVRRLLLHHALLVYAWNDTIEGAKYI